MDNIAEIDIHRDEQLFAQTRYSWVVSSFGAFPDESVGSPRGAGLHTVAAALQAAMSAAIDSGFDGARITYIGADKRVHTVDARLSAGPVTMDRARAAADHLLSQ
jgi:hypothetical protein